MIRASNPGIPYQETFNGPLRNGTCIYVKGHIPQGSQRFTFNLMTGKNIAGWAAPDIAFHFDIRFNERQVVRNTLINGGWGTEERSGPFPFFHGQSIDIIFRIEAQTIKVAVNNVHFIEYKHRIPVSRINTFQITGDVSISQVHN